MSTQTLAAAVRAIHASDMDTWKVGRDEPHPHLRILTSYVPLPAPYFATLLAGDHDARLYRDVFRLLGGDEWQYRTREAAQDGHADIVRRVRAFLETQELH